MPFNECVQFRAQHFYTNLFNFEKVFALNKNVNIFIVQLNDDVVASGDDDAAGTAATTTNNKNNNILNSFDGTL